MEMYFSALSAILTVVGVLFALWYGDIQKVIESDENPEDIEEDIINCIKSKIIPLFSISAVSVLVFLPVVKKMICDSVEYMTSGNAVYDPAKAIFLFLVVLLLFLAIVMCIDLCKLCNKKWGKKRSI
jgi:hypothetical protein